MNLLLLDTGLGCAGGSVASGATGQPAPVREERHAGTPRTKHAALRQRMRLAAGERPTEQRP